MNPLTARPTRRLLLTLAAVLLAHPATAQTLARPHWAGSGISSEAWWRNAVFYRIDPTLFQDSDGDGLGDLPGIAQRLDYLQSLGVDALILPAPDDDTAFNTLLREATARRIRIILSLPSEDQATLPGRARQWLTRGAAGIDVLIGRSAPPTLQQLRSLTDSFPGQRVLLVESTGGLSLMRSDTALQPAQLVATPILTQPLPAQLTPLLRLAITNAQATRNIQPLLLSDETARLATALNSASAIGLQKIIAATLFASRGAVSLLYGQELGLSASTTMQWTPSNITHPPVEPTPDQPASPPPDPDTYGVFKPYIRPQPARPQPARPQPARPTPAPTPGVAPPIDPDTLPGFSTRAPAQQQPASATNVASEDADPNSLLNFYRRLSQLHHGNPSLRSGTPTVFNHDAEQAIVWLRRAPAGARTAGTVIIACNLSARPITLSLDADLASLRLRSGTLRPLLASWSTAPIAQSTHQMLLPPYSVFIGELFH